MCSLFQCLARYGMKSVLLLVVSLVLIIYQQSRAMDVQIICLDGQSFHVARADAQHFDVFRRMLDGQHSGHKLNVLRVDCNDRSCLTNEVVGSLFQLFSGMSAEHLSDNCLTNSLRAAMVLQAPVNLISTLEREGFTRSFFPMVEGALGSIQAERDHIRPCNLSAVQSCIRSDKCTLDLHEKRLKTIIGWLLGPQQAENIEEIDLSTNKLTIPGLDRLGSFAQFNRLTRLNLANNNLDRLPAHFFVNIPTAVIINVAHNQIRIIEKDAFKGARTCSVNLCGNPIEDVQPGAMTVGLNKVCVLCSKGLPAHVQAEMLRQLSTNDFRSFLLINCGEFVGKLRRRDGYTPYIALALVTFVGNSLILPIIMKGKIPLSVPTVFIASLLNSVIVFKLFYSFCSSIARACTETIRQQSNRLVRVALTEEKEVQRKMFDPQEMSDI